MTSLVLAVFILVYAGMAIGRVPGLLLDRTGIALVGVVVLMAGGALSAEAAASAIDFPTLFVLFGLMILSAQYALSGFYDWCALRLARTARRPEVLLAATVLVGGVLSALLANDVVVYAMTPMLCVGLRNSGLDPRPFLIALAGAANCGSAATVIGNPQNILIGQVGDLDFWTFAAICAGPALAGLAVVHTTVLLVWRGRFLAPAVGGGGLPESGLDRWQLAKAVAATFLLLGLFASPLPQEVGVLAIAAALLVSRRLATRRMLGLVDWPLLLLFACLFAVTGAIEATGLPKLAVDPLAAAGLTPERLSVLLPLSLLASNTIGNVPAVVLLLQVWPDLQPGTLTALALFSTLAGNFLLVGSLANLIVVERAASVGVRLGFVEHARCGVPMTLVSLALAAAWVSALGLLPVL